MHCTVDATSREHVKLIGHVVQVVPDGRVRYWAAAPPTRGASFSGSGLPFASASQALDNSPNVGVARLDIANRFEISLELPNSYYEHCGTTLVGPTVYLEYTAVGGRAVQSEINVGEGVPFRSMTYPAQRASCMFYDGDMDLPVRTQEAILRGAGYPATNHVPPNFWGDKPRN